MLNLMLSVIILILVLILILVIKVMGTEIYSLKDRIEEISTRVIHVEKKLLFHRSANFVQGDKNKIDF